MYAESIQNKVTVCHFGHVSDFVTNYKISKYPFPVSFESPIESDNEFLEIIGETGFGIIRRVLGISGVKGVIIYPDILLVERDDSYSWDDLDPQIVEAILE